jgi:hypothetical protein
MKINETNKGIMSDICVCVCAQHICNSFGVSSHSPEGLRKDIFGG